MARERLVYFQLKFENSCVGGDTLSCDSFSALNYVAFELIASMLRLSKQFPCGYLLYANESLI